MTKNIKRLVVLTLIFTLLILYIKESNLIIKEFLSYTNLFITKLLPSVFIIYILSDLLINYGIINLLKKITKYPTTIYILLISLISGFPSGPKTIKNLKEQNYITEKESNKLIQCTHFPNPIFVFSTISLITKNIGIIYISIIISNLIILLKTKPTSNNKLPSIKEKDFTTTLSNSIIQTLKIIILIYGTSIFFYLISIIILNYFNTKELYIIINTIFDLTKGIQTTSLITNQTLKDLVIILLLTISPLNINIQIKSILSDTNIKYINFIKGRLISSFLTIIFYFLIRSL